MLNIVLFGPPGAGKGTQAAKLVEKYGLNHISTGVVIRDEIARQTPLGKSMEDYISNGELAPDELVINMVAEYVAERNKDCAGNIFDGFPRTTIQAIEFDKIMASHQMPVDVMLSLEVPEEELIKRLLIRGADSGRSDDSSEDVIRNRIEIYRRQTKIVTDFYAAQNKHIEIDGLGTVEEIFERLCSVIDRYL